jgi:ATPase subunit of ABC transporter with duplicated ATPase domains
MTYDGAMILISHDRGFLAAARVERVISPGGGGPRLEASAEQRRGQARRAGHRPPGRL